ncbi:hypothetical protein BSKO_00610 [Bryopsis sp. KO-2023]|nr:hypothetical protein BSKO_00610 [Bryopsis sp. KO-2023]
MADAIVTELGEYIESINLEGTMRPMVEAMLKDKPEDPTKFMADYLYKKANQIDSSGLIIHVSHKDLEEREFLEKCNFSKVVQGIGEELLESKPDNIHEHILRYLQKKENN